MYRVAHLYIYPIKSLAGIEVLQARALQSGFEYDRRWMLTDQNARFLTQREIPILSLFKTQIAGSTINVEYKSASFSFDVSESTGEPVKTCVFDDPADTVVVSEEADSWFSARLGRTVRLVRLASDRAREHFVKKHNNLIPVSLADGYPYLLLGTESLRGLNNKLTGKLSFDRFRPNIVVQTTESHEEDLWHNIGAGTAVFENAKPCGRCQIVTINQETAISDNEPLKVLNTYRRSANSVLFGINLICRQDGLVRSGDTVQIS